MSQTFRVLICEPLSPRAEEILEEQEGFEVLNHTASTREEILEATETADALIVRSGTRVDAELLGVGETLKVVARAGIGVDNVDLEAASMRGILVVNAPDGNVITTAEHTIAMMFSLARKIPSAVSSLKQGKWERSRFVGSELSSKTLGVVGMGRVGSQAATFARSLGMNVLAYDPYISAEVLSKRGVSPVDFDELLAKSDYITLHVPKTSETGNLIGAEEIARMRDGVRIINCARGGLIDEKALAEALDSGKVSGVAVDVYQQEPPAPDDPLIGRDDVVCTPHLGASTAEAQENVAVSVAKQVVAYLTEGVVGHAVNLPSLSPEVLEQIGPHLDLAERLGDFLAQLSGGRTTDARSGLWRRHRHAHEGAGRLGHQGDAGPVPVERPREYGERPAARERARHRGKGDEPLGESPVYGLDRASRENRLGRTLRRGNFSQEE